MKRDKIGGYLMVGLLGAEALLVLASWLLTAVMPDEFSRSLLSAEGIRWFMGHFALNMSSVWLVWLLLFSLAWGALRGSGVLRFQRSSYSQRLGMYWVIAELAVFVAMLLALTLPSHAILVNVMGGLFPSSFSACLVPYVCFAVAVMSITYGVMSEQLQTIDAIYHLLIDGIRGAAPLFLYYLLVMQLIQSVSFLFNITL